VYRKRKSKDERKHNSQKNNKTLKTQNIEIQRKFNICIYIYIYIYIYLQNNVEELGKNKAANFKKITHCTEPI